jgi:CxxC motif-containing protein (DUF1111 family)
VERTPDSTRQASLAANHGIKSQLGIAGSFNTSGNDGTITRFGWKAQNKSLMVFAGEAYNVEQLSPTRLLPTNAPRCSGAFTTPRQGLHQHVRSPRCHRIW